MAHPVDIKWLSEPEEQDYPAANSYLSLIYDQAEANAHEKALRSAPISQFKAKDIFRASGLSLLGTSNSHVAKDLDKVQAGRALSPLLLVRLTSQGKVIIADGYHRLCALYACNEDAVVPCKIV